MSAGVSRNNFFIAQVREYAFLERHMPSGIARVVDNSSGTAASCHPNIDSSGSVRGMKDRGYWDRTDKTVRANGFIYNISKLTLHNDDDRLAALACRCGGEGCYRYQAEVGFGPGAGSFDPRQDNTIMGKAEQIKRAAKAKADQALIPLEDAEDVIDVSLSIVVYLDPVDLPPVGSKERKEILAQHVFDWLETIGRDTEILAECIDDEHLIERRDISLKALPA